MNGPGVAGVPEDPGEPEGIPWGTPLFWLFPRIAESVLYMDVQGMKFIMCALTLLFCFHEFVFTCHWVLTQTAAN